MMMERAARSAWCTAAASTRWIAGCAIALGAAATLLVAIVGWSQPSVAQWIGKPLIAPSAEPTPLQQASPDILAGDAAAQAGDHQRAIEAFTRALEVLGCRLSYERPP